MGARLPPGEAERRAAERKRATFSGEKYRRYDPETEGYGNYAEWAGMAAAFVNGDVTFETETVTPKPTVKKKNSNPNLAALDLDEMPIEFTGLKSGYRRAVMAAFADAGSSDTSPAYVNAFRKITLAFETLKRQKGWK